MNSFWKYNLLSILWAVLILVLCLMPGKDLPSFSILEFDKVIHFFIYILLVLMMYYGWKKQNSFPTLHQYTLVKILFITSVYGFLVELLQAFFTADRHFDLFDALANSGGAVAGTLLSMYFKKYIAIKL